MQRLGDFTNRDDFLVWGRNVADEQVAGFNGGEMFEFLALVACFVVRRLSLN